MAKYLPTAVPGVVRKFHYHNPDDTAAIEVVQDVKGVLDQNKAQRNTYHGARTHWEDYAIGEKVASIPIVLWHEWTKELGDDPGKPEYEQWLNAKLNDIEFASLRTRPGKL